ncbi:DUF6113 family protein [Streptomyces cucumeris]|uniref:DUF6113 family protein n=1 Tax=Streptomyces cucumeris TaxID=2962890 RepID=UPI003EB8F218
MSAARLGAYVLLAVMGVLVGLAGALVQGAWFPGGLLLALLGVVALCYGGLKATATRMGGGVPAGAWTVTVLLLTSTRPEGDFLFGAGLGSYVFLLGGMFVGVICATLPLVPQPAARSARLGK